jgi:hypothetical protein
MRRPVRAVSTAKHQLTVTELKRILRVWQERLRLLHWEITVTFDVDTIDLGEAMCSEAYDEATIRFNRNFRTWSRESANRTVVHELLHVLMRDRTAAVESSKTLLSDDSYRMLIDRHQFEDEGVVERLAAVIVELGGFA